MPEARQLVPQGVRDRAIHGVAVYPQDGRTAPGPLEMDVHRGPAQRPAWPAATGTGACRAKEPKEAQNARNASTGASLASSRATAPRLRWSQINRSSSKAILEPSTSEVIVAAGVPWRRATAMRATHPAGAGSAPVNTNLLDVPDPSSETTRFGLNALAWKALAKSPSADSQSGASV